MNADLDKKLVAIRQKLVQQAPVETQENSVPVTDEASKQDAQELPKEQETQVVEPIVAEEPVKETPKADEGPTSWDEEETKPAKVESPKLDLSKLGSALGLEKVDSEDAIVEEVSKLKSKLKETEEQPLAGIPEDFKEVIEVAKSGDWKDYLASQLIDYTKLDPIEEFENDFLLRASKNPKYFTDGRFDQQKAEDALDQLPEATREYHGTQMLQAKAHQQAQLREQIKQKAQAKFEQAEKSLTSATKNLNELWDIKSHGLKEFEPKHSVEIYQGIVSSKLTKEYLGMSYEDLVRSGANMKVIAKTIAQAKYGDTLLKNKGNTARVETKKEMLDKMQNAQIKSTGSTVNPGDADKKEVTAVDKLKQFYRTSNKGL